MGGDSRTQFLSNSLGCTVSSLRKALCFKSKLIHTVML